QAKLAFALLRNLRFTTLGAKINGPLDGDLDFDLVFEGSNDVTVNNRQVTSPVLYRIRLQAPLLALFEQARVSTDYRLQLERAGVVPKAGVDK
ncbi:MAG: YdbH domain-containing protein, partial [Parvularculaceae bacterium]|nr:YdbH domain-containing protein [Parvularculaceae bacterium]